MTAHTHGNGVHTLGAPASPPASWKDAPRSGDRSFRTASQRREATP